MKKNSLLPFVSIITVNYNGKKYLGHFLESAINLNYPSNLYEVIVVDNASKDGSVAFIKKHFPMAKVVKSSKNLGFGMGNNLGIKWSKGELVFLVNNDTVLERESLSEIVGCFIKWSKKYKIGAVNAKLLLFDKYLELISKGAHFDHYDLEGKCLQVNREIFRQIDQRLNRYEEKIQIPFDHRCKGPLNLSIYIENEGTDNYQILLGGEVLKEGKIRVDSEPQKVYLEVPEGILEKAQVDLVQNAGNTVFRDGYSRDRGALVVKYQQYYEADLGQYSKEEFIDSFCGAGVLLSKKVMEHVGGFNKDFFMYYEDCDLSMRLKMSGWKILYCPTSVIRHIHSASSGEWSTFFTFQVERSRLLLLGKRWPRTIAVKEWLRYLVIDTFGYLAYYLSDFKKDEYLRKFQIKIKVWISTILPFILSLFGTKRLSYSEVNRFL